MEERMQALEGLRTRPLRVGTGLGLAGLLLSVWLSGCGGGDGGGTEPQDRPPVYDVREFSYEAGPEELSIRVVAHDPDGTPTTVACELSGPEVSRSLTGTGQVQERVAVERTRQRQDFSLSCEASSGGQTTSWNGTTSAHSLPDHRPAYDAITWPQTATAGEAFTITGSASDDFALERVVASCNLCAAADTATLSGVNSSFSLELVAEETGQANIRLSLTDDAGNTTQENNALTIEPKKYTYTIAVTEMTRHDEAITDGRLIIRDDTISASNGAFTYTAPAGQASMVFVNETHTNPRQALRLAGEPYGALVGANWSEERVDATLPEQDAQLELFAMRDGFDAELYEDTKGAPSSSGEIFRFPQHTFLCYDGAQATDPTGVADGELTWKFRFSDEVDEHVPENQETVRHVMTDVFPNTLSANIRYRIRGEEVDSVPDTPYLNIHADNEKNTPGSHGEDAYESGCMEWMGYGMPGTQSGAKFVPQSKVIVEMLQAGMYHGGRAGGAGFLTDGGVPGLPSLFAIEATAVNAAYGAVAGTDEDPFWE